MHTARPPLPQALLSSLQCLSRSRPFSQGLVRPLEPTRSIPKIRQNPLKSMKVATKDAMKNDAGMVNDIGLLPETFIMPNGANKPSFFKLPRQRTKLEWFRLKKRVLDFGGVVYYKWGITKPRPKLALWSTGKIAQALHRQMYTAFAENDLPTLTSTCASGLLSSFTSRLASLPLNETLRWTLHAYTRHPRVISHRAILLPMFKGAALRQAVVRLQSKQSLARVRKDGSVVEGTGGVREVKEYVVVQRRMWGEKEEGWIVWGTVEESDWRSVVPVS